MSRRLADRPTAWRRHGSSARANDRSCLLRVRRSWAQRAWAAVAATTSSLPVVTWEAGGQERETVGEPRVRRFRIDQLLCVGGVCAGRARR